MEINDYIIEVLNVQFDKTNCHHFLSCSANIFNLQFKLIHEHKIINDKRDNTDEYIGYYNDLEINNLYHVKMKSSIIYYDLFSIKGRVEKPDNINDITLSGEIKNE